eukprot:INCI12919.1.p1 GENE.INCI12919.1~~INCI12919.1.p1  ORF type:complete len:323 (-),score=57.39 INCI12919.1:64-1032(-)
MATGNFGEQAVLEKRRHDKAAVIRVVAHWWSAHLPKAKQALVRCILGKRTKNKEKNERAKAHPKSKETAESKPGTAKGQGRKSDKSHELGSAGAGGTAKSSKSAPTDATSAAADGVPSFPVAVEAMGSGTILIRELRVNKMMTVGAVKHRIEEHLLEAEDAGAVRVPRMQTQRLFKGHGGPELALNFRSLHAYKVKRGTVIVLGSILQQARTKRKKGKSKKKKRKPFGKIRLGAYGSETDFKVLMGALRTHDPSAVMERLGLTPRHEPYWTGADIVTKFFLDNLPYAQTILTFARCNRLPSLYVLEEWEKQLRFTLDRTRYV